METSVINLYLTQLFDSYTFPSPTPQGKLAVTGRTVPCVSFKGRTYRPQMFVRLHHRSGPVAQILKLTSADHGFTAHVRAFDRSPDRWPGVPTFCPSRTELSVAATALHHQVQLCAIGPRGNSFCVFRDDC